MSPRKSEEDMIKFCKSLEEVCEGINLVKILQFFHLIYLESIIDA